jgi:alkylated DNA nucleotide flippase Atl1
VSRPDPEEYVELVLSLVEEIPWGRVTSYGAIAAVVGGGPRQVGAVMARHGGPVPWWRVVRADGSLPASHDHEARPHYLEEGTPLRSSGAVDMLAAFWEPEPVQRADGSVDNSVDPVDELVEPQECGANPLRSRSPRA